MSALCRFSSLFRAAALLLSVLVFSSCATTPRSLLFAEADNAVQRGEYEQALACINDAADALYGSRDEVLYHLDKGLLHFYAGNHAESIEHLHQAEHLIEAYFTKSMRQIGASFLLNDTQLDYPGEDFEDIYLNIFKALSYLALDDRDGALVEIRRINNKLNLLEDTYRTIAREYSASDEARGVDFDAGDSQFHNSALARYLSLVMYRGQRNFDSVRIDWQYLRQAFTAQRHLYSFPIPLTEQVSSVPEDSRLSVLAFTGQAPVKLASTLWVHTYEDYVTVITASEHDQIGRIIDGYGFIPFPGAEEGYRFKLELPRMELRGSEIDQVIVYADGRKLGELGKLEDIQQIALETFQLRQPLVFLKSVLRTVTKGIASEAAGSAIESAGQGSLFGELVAFIAKVITQEAIDSTEQADLRMSRYFPAFAYVGEWDMPEGDYQMEIGYYRHGRRVFLEDLGQVRVRPDHPNLITARYQR